MSEERKEVAATQEKRFQTQLSIATESYMGVIQKQMQEGGAEFDEYSGKCVLAAMSAINNMIHNQGLTFNDLNGSNVNEILIKIATMKLNANAVPRECYFQIRNVNAKAKNDKEDKWEKQIEMGIEGDGNDAILARYGRDVKRVHQYWLVRSGDRFTYPKFNGLEMTAPQWEPTGCGDVVRVVYPIVKTDNTVEYHIGERRDVLKSLYAHINNNLMNETFGIIKGTKKDKYGKEVERTRYDATEEEKKKIAAKKKEIMKKAKELDDIDEILDNDELSAYISPAWTEPQSRESMIIRKMRNAVVKKIPKDFGSAIAAEQYNMMDDTYREVHAEIEDFANSKVFDAEYREVVEEPKKAPEQENTHPQEQEEPKQTEPEQKEAVKETEQPQEQEQQGFDMPDWMQG